MIGVEANFEGKKAFVRFRFNDREETFRIKDIRDSALTISEADKKITKTEISNAIKKEIEDRKAYYEKQGANKLALSMSSKETKKEIELIVKSRLIADKSTLLADEKMANDCNRIKALFEEIYTELKG